MNWVGRSILCAVFLNVGVLGLPLFAATQEPPSAPPTPAAESPAKEDGENAFHDPFATDSQSARPAAKTPDPLEPLNRAFFVFNDKLYFWALEPVSSGYKKVVPPAVRLSVKRFFANVKYPVRFVNNLLQGKIEPAGIETARFVVNSTVGIGGLMDPSVRYLKLENQPADFDQTLGTYGIPPGPFLNWPVLGASSVRGTVGMGGDALLTPWFYVDSLVVTLGVRPCETVNDTSLRLGEYESFKKAALDPYVAMRSFYFENRYDVIKRRLEGIERINVPTSEDRALARRVREERAIVHRLEFAQQGALLGLKGAERLLKLDSSVGSKPDPSYNLNVDLRHDSGGQAPPATNRVDGPGH